MKLSQRQIEICNHIRLPSKYRACTMDKVEDHLKNGTRPMNGDGTYFDKMKEYISQIPSSDGLYLYGKRLGHGKSGLAAIVLKEYAARYKYGLWIEYNAMYNAEISNAMFNSEQTMADKMRYCEVLVVNEFDPEEVENKNDDGQNSKSRRKTLLFEEILRERYARDLPTIITSNLDPLSMRDEYPHTLGIVSVLSDCTRTIKVSGRSWRPI